MEEEKKKRGRKPRRANCKMVSFELELETIERIEERADKEHTSKTAILKAAILAYLGTPVPVAAVAKLDETRAKLDEVRRILNTPRQSVCAFCYTCQFYNVAANAEPCATCFYSERKDNASIGNS